VKDIGLNIADVLNRFNAAIPFTTIAVQAFELIQ
jgi:hypothetical protein